MSVTRTKCFSMQFPVQRGNVTHPLGSNHRKCIEEKNYSVLGLVLKTGGFRGSDSPTSASSGVLYPDLTGCCHWTERGNLFLTEYSGEKKKTRQKKVVFFPHRLFGFKCTSRLQPGLASVTLWVWCFLLGGVSSLGGNAPRELIMALPSCCLRQGVVVS